MRKEIFGIFLFFLVIFTLLSLVSYEYADPSLFGTKSSGEVQNIFGYVGAHLSGLLIGLFGVGAFWFPILLLYLSFHFFQKRTLKTFLLTLFGGFLLIISTASLLALKGLAYTLFGEKFSSGGIVGIPIQSFLVRYSNVSGTIIILSVVLIISFKLMTGISLIRAVKGLWNFIALVMERFVTLIIKWRERRKKARKRVQAQQKKASVKKNRKIEIKTPTPKPIKEKPAPKQDVFEFMREEAGFQKPSVHLLDEPHRESP